MRITRASFVVPAAVIGALLGPLVGSAEAAPSASSSSPAANALLTSNIPSSVTVTFNEAITPVTGLPGGSSLHVLRNGTDIGCTASVVSNTQLVCPNPGGSRLPDGAYHVNWSATASPTALPDSGTSSGSFDFTVDTTAPAPSTLAPVSAARVQSPATVVATYGEKLNHATSTLVVKNSLDHTVAGTAVVTDNATTSATTWTPQLALTEGVYTATASATDLAGNANTTSWQFTVDNTPPAAPTNLSLPSAVNSANVSSFVVSGDADGSTPGSAATVVVTATDGSTTVTFPTATVSAGHWTAAATDLSSLKESAANSGMPITFSAAAFDVAGNKSSATTATAPKDTVAPGAPTVILANGVTTTINDANTTLGISGTGVVGDGITAAAWNTNTPGTRSTNTTSVGDGGSYSTTLNTTSLADGPIQLDVTEIDPAGNTSTTTLHLTKDTAAPVPAPSITAFGPVNIANASSPTGVSGTVPSDATSVQVWITDASTGTTDKKVVTPSGTNFTANFDTTSLAEGVITAHAIAFDAAGNGSDEGQAVSVKDLQAPGDPHFAPLPPAWANLSNYTQYPVGGTADPGATVVVTAADGVHLVSTQLTAEDTGDWSTTLDLSTLAENTPLTLTVTSTDEVGNPAAHSDSASTTKDIHAPSTPSAPTVADPTHGNTATVSGTGTPGDTIAITIVSDGGAGTATDSVTVAGDNTWTKAVDVTALPDGTLSATAVETDPAGNSSGASAAGKAVKDTTTLALAPAGTTPTDGQQLKPAALDVMAATYNEQIDAATSTIILKDSTGSALQTKDLAVSNGKTTISARPVDAPLDAGPYTVIFDVHDLSGVEHLVTTVNFVIDDAAPLAPPTIALGNATVANNGVAPVSGTTAEAGGSVTVTISDGVSQVSAPADLTGTDWTAAIDVSSLTNNGPLHATATQTDAAGNTSPVSSSADAWKDTTAPDKPAIGFSGPANHATSVVTLSGTGEAGDVVTVSVNDTDNNTEPVADSAVVATDGTWSKQLNLTSLTDGPLTATAYQTDEVGNVGAAQTADGVKDTVAPEAPTVGFSGPATIASPSVTLSGAGENGDIVTVTIDDSDVATQPVTDTAAVASGAWSKTLDLSGLSDGTLTATVTQVDSAGNVSADGQSSGLKDATAPGSPTIDVAGPASAGNVSAVPVSGTGTVGDTVVLQISDGTHPPLTMSLPVTTGSGGGVWSTTVDVHTLNDGALSTTATEVDGVGNSGTPAQRTFAMDTAGPTAPTIAWSGNVTKQVATVVFSGTAEPGSTVSLSVDDANPATSAVTATTSAGNSDGAWSKELTLSSLSDGTLSGTAFATDGLGNVGSTASATAVKDTVDPSATMTAPTKVFSLGAVTAAWRGSDAGSGLASAPYDVRWAWAAHGKTLGSYQRLGTGLTGTSITRTVPTGTTACFEARAHDAVGNVSGWTAPRCRTVALDDTALAPSAGWTRVRDRRLYHGSAFTTTANGATLTLAASQLSHVAIVATHCPTCGSIAIFVGHQRLQVINLRSAAVHRRVLTTLPAIPSRTGVVTIKVVSTGKRVQIDGVGTSTR